MHWLSETGCLKYVLSFLVKCSVFSSHIPAVALEFEEKAWVNAAFANHSCLTSKLIPDTLLNGLIFGCRTIVRISANFGGNS